MSTSLVCSSSEMLIYKVFLSTATLVRISRDRYHVFELLVWFNRRRSCVWTSISLSFKHPRDPGLWNIYHGLLCCTLFDLYVLLHGLTSVPLTACLVSHGNGRRVGSAVLITVMWILVTVQASNTWAYLENVCIQHSGETREAQLEASLSLQYEELFSLSVTNYVVALISILLADITMVRTLLHQIRL